LARSSFLKLASARTRASLERASLDLVGKVVSFSGRNKLHTLSGRFKTDSPPVSNEHIGIGLTK
jgi:hypothetical protein